jgi:diguanylate cyclase (GGDEF)-like protein
MDERAEKIKAQLLALNQAFADDLPDRLAEMAAAWADTTSPVTEKLTRLQMLAHRLAGGAGTFGFPETGEACRSLELTVQEMLKSQRALDGGSLEIVQQCLQAALHASPSTREVAFVPAPEPAPEKTAEEEVDPSALFLLSGDPALTSELKAQLENFGYRLEAFPSLLALMDTLAQKAPSALIVDVPDEDAQAFDFTTLQAFQAERSHPMPTIFLSGHQDLKARLQAVRVGARAYLSKPPDLFSLVEALDDTTQRNPQNPFSILVVEDDPSQAAHHAFVLQGAGMNVTVVTNPLAVMDPLVEARPDLILMDVYMPGCTGVELAAVIRQQEAYVGIPIVFLSRESALDFQLSAMQHGGDDFMIKPVDPRHMVSVITTRAQRGRVLRSHMVRDSLTGLLNHAAVMDQLDLEVARAQRTGEPLAFAMVDLDHFKRINDSDGHAAGDRVLQTLSRLLQQRLRKTDIIGRYGGEEFAIILPGADAASAANLLEDLRVTFAQISFPFMGGPVQITLSCGIATHPEAFNAEQLAASADEALYRAKTQGRNRVVGSQADS